MGRSSAGNAVINWFAEYENRRKPVCEVASPQLLALLEPLRDFLRNQLTSLDHENEVLSIIFTWNTEGALGFSLEGNADVVDVAVSLIGERAEFRSHQS